MMSNAAAIAQLAAMIADRDFLAGLTVAESIALHDLERRARAAGPGVEY